MLAPASSTPEAALNRQAAEHSSWIRARWALGFTALIALTHGLLMSRLTSAVPNAFLDRVAPLFALACAAAMFWREKWIGRVAALAAKLLMIGAVLRLMGLVFVLNGQIPLSLGRIQHLLLALVSLLASVLTLKHLSAQGIEVEVGTD